MRIGVALPTKGSATGINAVVNLLKNDSWLGSLPDGRPSARIATNWSWDATGTILHLRLRSNVLFHDGTPLSPALAAEALALSAKNWKTEAINFGSVSTVSPTADGVDIRLRERNGFVLSDLPAVSVVKPGDPAISTGPYKIDRADDKSATLSVFPQYYRGRPALAGITVANYSTQRSAWTALMLGDIDMLYEVSREAADFVEAETTVHSYVFPRPYYIPLVFNVRHPILKRADVRQAINEAIDRTAIVRDAMNGRGRPADGPISPENWAYVAPTTPFSFDPASAAARLDRAGLKTRADHIGAPERFSFTCLVFANDARFQRVALLVQKQLADVGIRMNLEPLAAEDLVPRLQSGKFDAFLFEMAGRSLGWVYYFWRHQDGGQVNSGYRAADAILDDIRVTLDESAIRAKVVDLQHILHEDPPAAFLAWQTTSRAVSTRFDVAPEENRDILTNIWQWRPAATK